MHSTKRIADLVSKDAVRIRLLSLPSLILLIVAEESPPFDRKFRTMSNEKNMK